MTPKAVALMARSMEISMHSAPDAFKKSRMSDRIVTLLLQNVNRVSGDFCIDK